MPIPARHLLRDLPPRSAALLLAAALLSCATATTTGSPAGSAGLSSRDIQPFSSDGCTLFPDGKPGDGRLWCGCCFTHDIAYWRGGTQADRLRADQALRACVIEMTGDTTLAAMMYEGVRTGGSAKVHTSYRWGYGWPFGRGYQALSDLERARSEERLREYFHANPGGYCARK